MTEDQFKRILTSALDEQSAKFDKRFEAIDKRFEAQDARFELSLASAVAKITDHVSAKIDAELGPMRAKIDTIYKLLDGLTKRIDDDDVERAAVTSQVNRHEGWIEQIAEATSTQLVPKLER